jgi:hypothetical protein
MIIKTKEDWKKLAADTIPKLSAYAAENRRTFDEEKARALLDKGLLKTLAQVFEKLWQDLPDNPGIRFGPFFDLCDLCSESWAVREDVK